MAKRKKEKKKDKKKIKKAERSSKKPPQKTAKGDSIKKMDVCPCCKKHCPLSKPKCGKGRKLAEKLGVKS